MTITWSRETSPSSVSGFVRVYPVGVSSVGYINDINFLHRVNGEYPDFYLSDATLVILTDNSGLTRGTP